LSPALIAEIKGYESTANRIIMEATRNSFRGRTFKNLTQFVDKFPQRLAGSQFLEDSIDYLLEKMEGDGLENVHGEEAIVPKWIRGEETGELLEPRRKNIPLLGLGTTIGTPVEGITAEVWVVRTFEELAANPGRALGKIIVYNQAFTSYEESVKYRSAGAVEAAKVGAVAALIRSIAPSSLNTPHTGTQDYVDGVTHIPVACITIEDAELLDRLQSAGEKLSIHLKMLDYNLPLTTSRNAIAELKGHSKPEEVVIVSGHVDSWDVGQGAMDDGGGCFISIEALSLLKSLNLRPKRTLRAIMWTGEEIGLHYWGSMDYQRHHADEMKNIIAAFESDGGTFTPKGLDFAGSEEAGCIVNEILKLLAPISATEYKMYDYVSTDIYYMIAAGIPGLSLNNENDQYFWYHHTEADTMSMMDAEQLDKGTAVWAVASYIIADLSIPLPRKAPAAA
jgi:carboxypeptidase Q